MSTASEKAADRMHADLEAMRNSARMYAGLAATENFRQWEAAYKAVETAMGAMRHCMSERDRKLAQG